MAVEEDHKQQHRKRHRVLHPASRGKDVATRHALRQSAQWRGGIGIGVGIGGGGCASGPFVPARRHGRRAHLRTDCGSNGGEQILIEHVCSVAVEAEVASQAFPCALPRRVRRR